MKHYYFVKDSLGYFVVFFLTTIVFTDFIQSFLDLIIALVTFVVITLPFMYPVFVLHRQYYQNDKSLTFSIENGCIVLDKEGEEKKIEIKKTTRFKRFKKGELYFQYLPWAEYYYLEIESIDHSIFFLSCLSAKGRIEEFGNIIEEQKSFPTIKPHWLEKVIK